CIVFPDQRQAVHPCHLCRPTLPAVEASANRSAEPGTVRRERLRDGDLALEIEMAGQPLDAEGNIQAADELVPEEVPAVLVAAFDPERRVAGRCIDPGYRAVIDERPGGGGVEREAVRASVIGALVVDEQRGADADPFDRGRVGGRTGA